MTTISTPEEKLAFLMACFHNNTNDSAIDFDAVASETGAADQKTARRYFKTIIESTKKYDLTSTNKVVLKGEAPTTPASGRKRGRSKKEGKETPSKARKTKKTEEEVEAEAEAEDQDDTKEE